MSATTPSASPIKKPPYVGRFAPSPSGPLHFGSLVCALASYLDAKQHSGKWLVRIEDIDPPREQPGATAEILKTLEAHGLNWDGEVMYQSHRSAAYLNTLAQFKKRNLTYPCNCIRKRLQALNGPYDKRCQKHPPDPSLPAAIRITTSTSLNSHLQFNDGIQGEQSENLSATGDFIVHRKDGLFAYQLAVVVDDIAQGITDVVRGVDLLSCTARQMYLFNVLGATPPRYAHIPVVVDERGDKLSKQTFAPPIDNRRAIANITDALTFLNIALPPESANCKLSELLAYAVKHWSLTSFS